MKFCLWIQISDNRQKSPHFVWRIQKLHSLKFYWPTQILVTDFAVKLSYSMATKIRTAIFRVASFKAVVYHFIVRCHHTGKTLIFLEKPTSTWNTYIYNICTSIHFRDLMHQNDWILLVNGNLKSAFEISDVQEASSKFLHHNLITVGLIAFTAI